MEIIIMSCGDSSVAKELCKRAAESRIEVIDFIESLDEFDRQSRKNAKTFMIEAGPSCGDLFMPKDYGKTKTPNHRKRRKGWE
jgi:hypothetical protein